MLLDAKIIFDIKTRIIVNSFSSAYVPGGLWKRGIFVLFFLLRAAGV